MELKETMLPKAGRQYDKIVEGYKKQTERPLRKFAYDYTLIKNLGNLTGKRVLDLACGEGMSSRLARDLGASEIVGVDESEGQIKKAIEQEDQLNIPQEKRIKYIVADGAHLALDPSKKFDVVTGMMFLHYASSREKLQQFIKGIKESLKDEGTFYAILPNPDINYDYDKYGIKTHVESEGEGSVIKTEIFENPDGSGPKLNEFDNYLWSRDTYQSELENQGFWVEWIDSEVSPEGIARYGEKFWEDFKKQPFYVMIKAKLKDDSEGL